VTGRIPSEEECHVERLCPVKAVLRFTLLITPCGSALVSVADAGTFQVEPSKSALVAQIFRDGMASRIAHDRVVQATSFSGRIIYDPAVPSASSISVEVNAASLKVDAPEIRRQFHLSGLYVAKFPRITFTSTSITSDGHGQLLVSGHLTIRGVNRVVRFPAKVVMEGPTLQGTATLEFSQSAFGYRPYNALLGAIKNKDAMVLHVDLVAIPE